MNHYQVLFSGEVVEGAQESTVRRSLARELRIDERKASQLFSGRTVVIRSQLSQDDAFALQISLRELGARTRIKDFTPRTQEKKLDYRVDREERNNDQTLKDITAAHLECPRCGHLQLEASHCAKCGINIAAAIKAQRKEDLLIEKKIRELRDGQKTREAKNVTPMRKLLFGAAEDQEHSEEKAGKIRSWFRKSS